MRGTRILLLMAMSAISVNTLGCIRASLRSTDDPAGIQYEGIGKAYVALGSEVMGPPPKEILRLGVFGHATRRGEIVSLDLWPLFGVGIGVAGARLQLLPLEVGAGVLFYHPKPRSAPKRSKGKELPSDPDVDNRHDEGIDRLQPKSGDTDGDTDVDTVDVDDSDG